MTRRDRDKRPDIDQSGIVYLWGTPVELQSTASVTNLYTNSTRQVLCGFSFSQKNRSIPLGS